MISVKRADGSDALAVNACMPLHHVQSTKVSREILERAGIDLEAQHRYLWREFLRSLGDDREPQTLAEFEAICSELKLRKPAPTNRKNR